jgi:hypothetical protein
VNDTDGDGVEDGPEVNRLNTDPTQADSDSDGTDDGQETYTLTVENKTADVTVKITGEGNVARGLDIRRVTENETDTARIGHGIRVDTNRDFQYAKVTQPVSDSVSVDKENVSLYKWSRTNDDGLHQVNATYDAGANTVTANVTSFSSFNVMDQSKIEEQNTQIAHIDNTWPTFEGFDGGPWSGAGEVTTKNSKLVIDHNTSISDAGSWAEETIDLTDSYVNATIHAGGSVSAGSWGYAKVYVVNPTDPAKEGYWNSTNRVVLGQAYGDPDGGESSGLASKNISQFIGSKAEIRAVAYGDAEVNIDWIRVERHSDKDGISDAVEKAAGSLEERALIDGGRGEKMFSLNFDYKNKDTDNDGLGDSGEVKLSCTVCMTPEQNISVNQYIAHPNRKRTDATAGSDGEEVNTTTSSTTTSTNPSVGTGTSLSHTSKYRLNPKIPEYFFAGMGLMVYNNDGNPVNDNDEVITADEVDELSTSMSRVAVKRSSSRLCDDTDASPLLPISPPSISPNCMVSTIHVIVTFVSNGEGYKAMYNKQQEAVFEYNAAGELRSDTPERIKFNPHNMEKDPSSFIYTGVHRSATYTVRQDDINSVRSASLETPVKFGSVELELQGNSPFKSGRRYKKIAVPGKPMQGGIFSIIGFSADVFEKGSGNACKLSGCEKSATRVANGIRAYNEHLKVVSTSLKGANVTRTQMYIEREND